MYIKKSLWTLYEKAAKEGKVAAITQNPPPARSYSDIKTAEWRKAKRDAERDSMGLIPQKPKAAYPNPKPVKKETVQGSKVKNGKKRDGKSETLRKRLKRIKKEKGELGKKERK